MFLKDINLRNFRNYETLRLELSPNVNLIIGENAQGKTNILEAIHFLSTAKSHRTPRDDDLIQNGKPWFYLKGEVTSRITSNIVEITNTWGEKKRIRIDGKPQDRISNVIGKINVVIFSPEDLSLVKGAPSGRRRFLDVLISQIGPAYLHALQDYNSALRQRNELLRSIRDRTIGQDSLSSWDEVLVESGAEITRQRLAVVGELSELAREKHGQLTSHQEELDIKYSCQFETGSKEEIKREYAHALEKSIDSDIRRGLTSVGPHRDDLLFSIDGADARKFCSQGQQRTAVLSLKMANLDIIQRKLDDYPIILLDDVSSELDKNRISFLFRLLNDTPVQALLTATNIEDLSIGFSEYELFTVKNGSVERRTESPSAY